MSALPTRGLIRFEVWLDRHSREDLQVIAWMNREPMAALARRFIEQGLRSARSRIGDDVMAEFAKRRPR